MFTLPPVFSALESLARNQLLLEQFVWASLWCGWIWGIPTAAALYEWRLGALAGVTNHSYMVRRFWKIQCVTAGIPAVLVLTLLLLLLVICSGARF